VALALRPHTAVSGSVQLYRPSAVKLDRTLQLQPDANGVQKIDAAGLSPGLWKVRVSWRVEQQEYFLDQNVVISAATS
jgi:nitrogen fixation protein FixH